jgi:cyclic pyranopterin phosphate synthase
VCVKVLNEYENEFEKAPELKMDYDPQSTIRSSSSIPVTSSSTTPVALMDGYKRRINYLRLSITDLCNLRCVYCMPEGGVPKLHHNDILTYEEITRLARVVVGMGINRIRITGGEPLVRRDVLRLCRDILQIEGLESLSMTTNGLLLSRFARELHDAGMKRINISLDTLKPEKYAAITRRDCFHEVWRGIEAAQEVGFDPVKLNVVVMQGVNDDEIEDLALLTYRYPFDVRFIEFMPFQPDEQSRRFLSADEILTRLARVAQLSPVQNNDSNGPAQHYAFPGAKGRIGLISPVSHHFCPSCNRLRVTADGKLRTCLFSTDELDLKPLLRQASADDQVVSIIRNAIRSKPERHMLDKEILRKCTNRPMSAIGG